MGTKADFYIGIGQAAKWRGSIAFDGNLESMQDLVRKTSKHGFKDYIRKISETKSTFISPDDGWPWSWSDSRGTDCAYCWDKSMNCVRAFRFGREVDLPEWLDLTNTMAELENRLRTAGDYRDGGTVDLVSDEIASLEAAIEDLEDDHKFPHWPQFLQESK